MALVSIELTQSILSYILTAIGGGAIAKTWIERRIPSIDSEELARQVFRTDLMKQVKELRDLHEKCQEDRIRDASTVAYLKGQVELLTGSMTWVPKAPLEEVTSDPAPMKLASPSHVSKKKDL